MISSDFLEPSDGLEPSTPSLPWLVFGALGAGAFATGCRWLRPLGSIRAPSSGASLGARADASAGHPPQYAVSTRRSNAFATTGEGGESLTVTTIWRVASLLEYAIVL
jgi:hypothetical protein